MKKKILKNVMIISIFMIIGIIIGYCVALTQENQLMDSEYIKFWTDMNMPVPESVSYSQAIIGLLMIFGGIPFLIVQLIVLIFVKEKRV